MADYQSKYTGMQVDTAVETALSIQPDLDKLLKTTDINVSVAGLPLNLPIASTEVKGIISVGSGLSVTTDGKLSTDMSNYYVKEEVDNKIDGVILATDEAIGELSLKVDNITTNAIDVVDATNQSTTTQDKYYCLNIITPKGTNK